MVGRCMAVVFFHAFFWFCTFTKDREQIARIQFVLCQVHGEIVGGFLEPL